MEQSFERNNNEAVLRIARFLDENKAGEVVALDIGTLTSIADFFVIATASSDAQLHGLQRQLHELLDEIGLPARQSIKRNDTSGWLLLDSGSIIVHLMLAEQRQFYELEKLWFDAKVVFRAEH